MDIGKAFTFTFDDEDWLPKILMGGLFMLLSVILIGIPFVYGYMLETLKNVYLGSPRPLPKWGDNLGGLFGKGLKAIVGGIIWSLPGILFSCIVGLILAPLSSSTARNQEGLYALLQFCLNCVGWVYSLLVAAILPAALMKFAVTEDIGEFFKFGEIFGFISRNLGNYLVAIIVYWLASIVAGFGVILCVIGVIFTVFWALLVQAHLFGQVYRLAKPA